MASKREPSPSMRMRKIALVICEGVTEERYINLLRKWYKSPIKTYHWGLAPVIGFYGSWKEIPPRVITTEGGGRTKRLRKK
jgi:hypothetical protein